MKLKKLFALALCVAMTLGLLTVTAGAEGESSSEPFTPKEHASVETRKNVVKNDNGTYTITLESWVTGSSVTTSTTSAKPTDIVLVLDYSASMSNDMESLRTSVRQFIDTVAKESTAENKHRIALVTFGSAKNGSSAYKNTELYIGKNSAGADSYGFESYPNLNDSHYTSAFISANDATQVSNMKDAVKKYCNGETAIDLGLEMAASVLAKNPLSAGEDRNRVVIVFTDGEPTHYGTGYNSDVADAAIKTADSIKGSGVKVYSIGLFDSADETVVPTDNFNTFLHKISSNETYPQTPSYYYALQNSSKLSEIFSGIASSVTSGGAGNTKLDSTTVLQDVVTEYFEIPSEHPVKVHTESISSDGQSWTANNDVRTVTPVGNKVSVTDFDYVANWVGPRTVNGVTTYAGKKLVVEIVVQPKAGFLGGEDVPTNVQAESGIYKGEEWAEHFPNTNAKADVPIPTLTVTAADKNVYLLGDVSADEMKTGVVVKCGDETLNLADLGWRDDYVTTELSATAKNDLTADSTYEVSLTVTPTTAGTVAKQTFTDEAKINVFKPTLTYPEYTVYLGGSVPAFAPETVVWKHGNTVAPASMGTAPTLTGYTYSQSSGFTGCTDVSVTDVKIGTTSVKDHVTAAPFKVHVMEPTITLTPKESTVYYGNDAVLTPADSWKCTCDSAKTAPSAGANKPDFTYEYSSSALTAMTECQMDVTASIKIGDKTFTSNEVDVHVVQPVLGGNDITIYRGNSIDLDDQMNAVVWKDVKSHSVNAVGTAPAPNYTYHDGAAVSGKDTYSPADCKEVTATWNLGGTNFTAGFNVHVLQPVFDVTTQDVWADCGTVVDLTDNCLVKNGVKPYTLTWKDGKEGLSHTAGAAAGTEPIVSSYSYTYSPAATNGKYTVGESDQAFSVTELSYTFSNGLTDKAAFENKAFTVHVNTFALTINKTWSGSESYKQDAIFTVSGNGGTLKVVIPKGKTSVTIAGLLCGKSYTVAEDGNWSWRWTTESAKTATHMTHAAVTTEAVNNDQSMSFQNTLNTDKVLWLSGSYYIHNYYDGSWKIKKNS